MSNPLEYVYLFLTLDDGPPSANIPIEQFPAAPDPKETALDAVAEETTQPEYVYFSLVVDAHPVIPRAKMPSVLFPAAVPELEATFDDVAEVLEHEG